MSKNSAVRRSAKKTAKRSARGANGSAGLPEGFCHLFDVAGAPMAFARAMATWSMLPVRGFVGAMTIPVERGKWARIGEPEGEKIVAMLALGCLHEAPAEEQPKEWLTMRGWEIVLDATQLAFAPSWRSKNEVFRNSVADVERELATFHAPMAVCDVKSRPGGWPTELMPHS